MVTVEDSVEEEVGDVGVAEAVGVAGGGVQRQRIKKYL